MPTIVVDGRFRFVVNTRENPREPPHVHVWEVNESVCRIDLVSGLYMDEPPPGSYRAIMTAFLRHADAIQGAWNDIHGA